MRATAFAAADGGSRAAQLHAWLAGRRGEAAVSRALRRRLAHVADDVILPDGRGGLTQIDHLALTPTGVLVVETNGRTNRHRRLRRLDRRLPLCQRIFRYVINRSPRGWSRASRARHRRPSRCDGPRPPPRRGRVPNAVCALQRYWSSARWRIGGCETRPAARWHQSELPAMTRQPSRTARRRHSAAAASR